MLMLVTAVQVIFLSAIFMGVEYLGQILHIPLPANLLGMLVVLLLLFCRIVPLKIIKSGSNWLLSEMLLFFVPAVVAVVNFKAVMLTMGVQIFAVIILSSCVVLIATAFIVNLIYKFEVRK